MTLTLLMLCLLSQLAFEPIAAALQGAGGLPSTIQSPKTNTSNQQGTQINPKIPEAAVSNAPKPLLAPPVDDSRPFLRLIAILFVGLGIPTLRLWHKFRKLLGLGVFTNIYSALFLLLGAGISGFPMTSHGALSSHLANLGEWRVPWTWITDLSGAIFTLAFQTIPFKKKAAASPVSDLKIASSNPIVAILEDGICDHILARMRPKITEASHRYSWSVINSVARRTLEEEIMVGRLKREEFNDAINSIAELQESKDALADYDNRYRALVRILAWCPFSRLRDSLAAAAAETQP